MARIARTCLYLDTCLSLFFTGSTDISIERQQQPSLLLIQFEGNCRMAAESAAATAPSSSASAVLPLSLPYSPVALFLSLFRIAGSRRGTFRQELMCVRGTACSVAADVVAACFSSTLSPLFLSFSLTTTRSVFLLTGQLTDWIPLDASLGSGTIQRKR